MSETILHYPELKPTKNVYGLPVPEGTKVRGLIFESSSHFGIYSGAVDIAVELDTPVLAPLDGIVDYVRDINSEHGLSPEFAKLNNFIEIKHSNGELSHLSHIAKDSSMVKVGDKVLKGQEIAKVGLVGYTSAPHLHFWVVKLIRRKPGFIGLRIRTEKPLEDLIK